MRTDRRKGGEANMTKVIVAFCNLKKPFKKVISNIFIRSKVNFDVCVTVLY